MEPLWTARDVQTYLKIGRSTMYAMLARGELPEPIRVGPKAPRWDPELIRSLFNHGNDRDGQYP